MVSSNRCEVVRMTGRPTNWEHFSSQRPKLLTKLTGLYNVISYKLNSLNKSMGSKLLWLGLMLIISTLLSFIPAVKIVGDVLMIIGVVLLFLDK